MDALQQALLDQAPKAEPAIGPGFYTDLSNEAYHSGPGISKSQLDLVNECPALLQWAKDAPRDPNKTKALDFGDALHALLLEPHRFKSEYAVAPENAPRNTNAGKEKWAEFEASIDDETVITAEEYRMLMLMRESVYAHPLARFLLEQTERDVEASIYWTDPETGLLCRIRPDLLLHSFRAMIDVKSVDNIDKFHFSVRDYRYDVQDAYYGEGFYQHFGYPPEEFLFLAVGKTINCGRYPVRIYKITEEDRLNAQDEFRRNLRTVATCSAENNFPGIQTISVPKRFGA